MDMASLSAYQTVTQAIPQSYYDSVRPHTARAYSPEGPRERASRRRSRSPNMRATRKSHGMADTLQVPGAAAGILCDCSAPMLVVCYHFMHHTSPLKVPPTQILSPVPIGNSRRLSTSPSSPRLASPRSEHARIVALEQALPCCHTTILPLHS